MADEERKSVTALDRVVAREGELNLTLMVGSDRLSLDMDHKTALDIVQTIADAITQLRAPDVDPQAGVALYEATKFEAHPERIPKRLGLEEKLVITASGQGATKITLRLDPSRVDAFLAQAEQHSMRRRKATRQ